MEAGKRTFTDILTGNRLLEIPFYQRAYVWKEDQWERFLADMVYISQSGNQKYFLGSIILKQQNTNAGSKFGDIRTVIDGQQRLTTITVFMKVLCLMQNNNELFNRYFRLIGGEPAIQHNHNDIKTFIQIINLTTLENLEFSEENNLGQSYIYFMKKADPSIIDLTRILSKALVVGIDLSQDDDEQQIFDTINSLGVRLTTAELLKNYLFDRTNFALYSDYWKSVFEDNEEVKSYWDTEVTAGRQKRNNIDMFLDSYLQIKMQEPSLSVTSVDKIQFGKVENLFQSYKLFIEKYIVDKEELTKEIHKYAKIFYKNFQPTSIHSEISIISGLNRLNVIIYGLETTTLISYILFVLNNQPNIQEQEKIFAYLEAFIMRRMVCRLTTKNYNQLFGDRLISNQIITLASLKDFIKSQDDKINYFPSDDEVKDSFKTSKLTNKQAAGILYFLESKIRDRGNHSTALLGLSHYSLEHVMPKKWQNNWNNVLTDEEIVNRDRTLLTLGNLTIITSNLNSSIRDSGWDSKKNGRDGYGGLISFSSGIQIIGRFLQESEWNEAVIERRADYLASEANRIWVE